MNLKNKTAISAVSKSFIYVAVLRDTALNTSCVIELNPERNPDKKCIRVGRISGLRHAGQKKGGRHLRGKCLKLRPDLYEFYNPMPLLESLELERDLAEDLRKQGHTVLGGH